MTLASSSAPDSFPYSVRGDLPLVVEPRGDDAASRSVARLRQALKEHEAWVGDALARHGAMLFRGFDVAGADDFEQLARAIDDELKNEYLGTSPRDAVAGSSFVFSASELPDYYPIPQHCEMSFCATPPRHVFFSCLVEPAAGSGETPLCDFRAVWRDLDPGVRERFVAGGIRHVRNYAPPGSDANDPMQLKGWDEMFQTTDREAVERRAREEGFEPSWTEGGGLRLVSTQPVYRDHPTTGERAWHNHATTFHVGTAFAEYRRIVALRPTERNRNLAAFAEKLDERARSRPSDERAMHTTYADGSEIPDADMEAVRDAVWRHMVVTPWKRGDVVAIDNAVVSHGRLPYEGPRQVVVCWA